MSLLGINLDVCGNGSMERVELHPNQAAQKYYLVSPLSTLKIFKIDILTNLVKKENKNSRLSQKG